MKPTVAFLQNPWFKPGTPKELIQRYIYDREFRSKVLSMSVTGSRLLTAFGQDLYRHIWWDNVAPMPGDKSSAVTRVDMSHCMSVIAGAKAEIILTFGKLAEDTLDVIHEKYLPTIPVLSCPHPCARGLTQDEINQFAETVKKLIC